MSFVTALAEGRSWGFMMEERNNHSESSISKPRWLSSIFMENTFGGSQIHHTKLRSHYAIMKSQYISIVKVVKDIKDITFITTTVC